MDRKKCSRCGLVNQSTDEACRRCGASLGTEADYATAQKRGIGKRLIWIFATTIFLLFIGYLSLLLTSDDLDREKRQTVERAIAILEQKGFDREAFVLATLVKYRGTDNWWNRYVGHRDAYAATNFPFEVVTVYPEFFEHTLDDHERAAILLHEAYHLLGSGEAAALERVWREKQKLGWTADNYSQSRVWNNTRELTAAQVPTLFQCGSDGRSDCTQ
ncbi:MAG: hypothetical protein ACRD6N_19655 [Pyrinomonadaceae bacterium]